MKISENLKTYIVFNSDDPEIHIGTFSDIRRSGPHKICDLTIPTIRESTTIHELPLDPSYIHTFPLTPEGKQRAITYAKSLINKEIRTLKSQIRHLETKSKSL